MADRDDDWAVRVVRAYAVFGVDPTVPEFGPLDYVKGIIKNPEFEKKIRRVAGGKFGEKPEVFLPEEEKETRADLDLFGEEGDALDVPEEEYVPTADAIRTAAQNAEPGSLDDLLSVGEMGRRLAASKLPDLTGLDPDGPEASAARLAANRAALEEAVGTIDPAGIREKVEAGAAKDIEGLEMWGDPVTPMLPSGKRRLTDAASRYPATWGDEVNSILDRSTLGTASRGIFGEFDDRPGYFLGMVGGAVSHGTPTEAIAIHELGHGLEMMIPGLREMQTEFWKRRVGDDQFTVEMDGGLVPSSPERPTKDMYSMKRYADDTGELFTTGVEDVLGSGALKHVGAPGGDGFDEDFLNFIWGALLTLNKDKR